MAGRRKGLLAEGIRAFFSLWEKGPIVPFLFPLGDLKNLTQSLSVGMSNQDVCHLWTCPRLSFLKRGLEETVEVLERTKNSFKSRELGDLRKKLEGLMKTLS